MADVNEMLRKHQQKIEKAIGTTKPKKIDRDGESMRPWSYALTQDQTVSTPEVAPLTDLSEKEDTGKSCLIFGNNTGKEPEKYWKGSGDNTREEPEKSRKNTGNDFPLNWKNTGIQTGNDSGKEPEKFRKNSGKIFVDEPRFSTLSGLQRQIVEFFYNESLRTPDKATPIFRLEFLGEVFQKSTHGGLESIRKSIYALQKKHLIHREFSKHGPGGFTKYRLNDTVFNELRDLEIWKNSGKIPEKNRNNTGSQTGSQTGKMPSSSSSSLRSIGIKEELLTTGEPIVADELGAAWQKIDYSALTEIRFGRHQIVQIAREGKSTPDELQDSIYAFAFDLLENGKAKTITGVPLNYFMGILRRGPYAAPSNYESPDVRQKRLYLESKEQQRKKLHELDERLEAAEFDEWLEKLSLEQRATVVPPKDFAKPGGTAHNYQMREYFRENVWPDVRNRIAHESQLNLSFKGIENQ
jgi:hypothetical protein